MLVGCFSNSILSFFYRKINRLSWFLRGGSSLWLIFVFDMFVFRDKWQEIRCVFVK